MGVGLGIDGLDQGAAYTGAAGLGHGVEVLQVADLLDLPAVAMEKVMGQADELSVLLGHQRVEVARIISKKAFEGGGIDCLGNGGLVKGQVGLPEYPPRRFVIGALFGWVMFASRTGLPVSTTHAMTGAILGAAIVMKTADAVHWSALGMTVLAPLALSPLIGGLAALGLLRRRKAKA